MEGTVNAISEKNNSVLIGETWYKLGPNIKLSYVKKGQTDYKLDENDQIVFIKSTSKFVPKTFPRNNDTQKQITNQWAINAAIKMYESLEQKPSELDVYLSTIEELAIKLKQITEKI